MSRKTSKGVNVFIEKKTFSFDRSRHKAFSYKPSRLEKGNENVSIEDSEINLVELGDEAFLAGNLDMATNYYVLAMEKEATFDLNNNPDTSNLSWSSSFISQKLSESDKKIELKSDNASYYLEKAALLFFENKWSDARILLAEALSNCSEKSEIRNTIGHLNKVERMFSGNAS